MFNSHQSEFFFTFHGYFHCVKFYFDRSKGKNYIFEVYFCHALLAHISDVTRGLAVLTRGLAVAQVTKVD